MSKFTFTIGEVVALLGITPKTIMHYHEIGLLAQPERDANNYRRYSMAHIVQLQQILRLKQFGLSLKQIDIIIKSENPDALAQVVLSQHANQMRDDIARLQHQLDITKEFLDSGGSLSPDPQPNKLTSSSIAILSDEIKTRSYGVSDIVVEVEREVMHKLDQFSWSQNYELFWQFAGRHFMNQLEDEGLFIFWMERYLALRTMDADDLQGNHWLQELHRSPARRMLTQTLIPPPTSVLPEDDQQKILKLLISLLYQEGSSLQRHFLGLLISR